MGALSERRGKNIVRVFTSTPSESFVDVTAAATAIRGGRRCEERPRAGLGGDEGGQGRCRHEAKPFAAQAHPTALASPSAAVSTIARIVAAHHWTTRLGAL